MGLLRHIDAHIEAFIVGTLDWDATPLCDGRFHSGVLLLFKRVDQYSVLENHETKRMCSTTALCIIFHLRLEKNNAKLKDSKDYWFKPLI